MREVPTSPTQHSLVPGPTWKLEAQSQDLPRSPVPDSNLLELDLMLPPTPVMECAEAYSLDEYDQVPERGLSVQTGLSDPVYLSVLVNINSRPGTNGTHCGGHLLSLMIHSIYRILPGT